jgi:hypothetical protein
MRVNGMDLRGTSLFPFSNARWLLSAVGKKITFMLTSTQIILATIKIAASSVESVGLSRMV